MTRKQILEKRLEMATHNLLCSSSNYAMDEPKPGSEDAFKEALEEVELLRVWLREFHGPCADSTVEYIGYISTIAHGKTYDGKPLCTEIELYISPDPAMPHGDMRILKVAQEAQHWFVGADGMCCGRYDIEKDRRDSRLVKLTVDTINYIRAIEWVESEEGSALLIPTAVLRNVFLAGE